MPCSWLAPLWVGPPSLYTWERMEGGRNGEEGERGREGERERGKKEIHVD